MAIFKENEKTFLFWFLLFFLFLVVLYYPNISGGPIIPLCIIKCSSIDICLVERTLPFPGSTMIVLKFMLGSNTKTLYTTYPFSSPRCAATACELLPTEFSAIVVALLRLTFICDPRALVIIFIKLIELVTFSPRIIIISLGSIMVSDIVILVALGSAVF